MMRYHFKKPDIYCSVFGDTYECQHPIYTYCTLYTIGKRGLAIVQQRFDHRTKVTRWTEIDPWLTDPIYLHPKFKEYFDEKAGEPIGGLYPTVTIRQVMWGLKMKPLPKERWETYFDRQPI